MPLNSEANDKVTVSVEADGNPLIAKKKRRCGTCSRLLTVNLCQAAQTVATPTELRIPYGILSSVRAESSPEPELGLSSTGHMTDTCLFVGTDVPVGLHPNIVIEMLAKGANTVQGVFCQLEQELCCGVQLP